ncbi:MAG: hypothetical protein MUF71_01335 [Candidatus Kapabacteria bacterium]|jgi:hypothetical protein|nr:hypothetical protein [Candidatus Kapabacteria bacterium]
MIAAIKQHAVVKKGGLIEIYAPELTEGTEVEVTAVISFAVGAECFEMENDTSQLFMQNEGA